jgi:hypothetical protein
VPSTTHDGLVRLFRERPELAAELLKQCLETPVPRYQWARLEPEDLTQVRSVEFHVDAVVSYNAARALFAVIVEVQLSPDHRKRFSWPAYATSLRARLKCPVALLVVTPSARVARWARRPIIVGPGTTCSPVVLGPAVVPAMTSRRDALENPELAVLSAIAHGKGDRGQAVRIAKAAAAGAASVSRLDEDTGLLYFAAIRDALGPAARKAFEMIPNVERYLDAATRKKIQRARTEGKEALVQSKHGAVLAVLQARGLSVTDRQRARIAACTRVATLDAWLRRAVTAPSTTAVFARRAVRNASRAVSGPSSRARR